MRDGRIAGKCYQRCRATCLPVVINADCNWRSAVQFVRNRLAPRQIDVPYQKPVQT